MFCDFRKNLHFANPLALSSFAVYLCESEYNLLYSVYPSESSDSFVNLKKSTFFLSFGRNRTDADRSFHNNT